MNQPQLNKFPSTPPLPSHSLVSALCALALLLPGFAAQPEFPFHDGDRIAFLGDSITEQHLYTAYVEAYLLTRFPKKSFRFRNVGLGGDTAWMLKRSRPDEAALFAAKGDAQQELIGQAVDKVLMRDVVSWKPTVVFVAFGMNDFDAPPFNEDRYRTYLSAEREIVKVLNQNHVRTILLSAQPVEPRTADPAHDPRNLILKRFGEGLKDVADETGSLFVDQFGPYMVLVQSEHGRNPRVSVGRGDDVHPGPTGHTLMAGEILQQLKAPDLVSSAALEITAEHQPKLVAAEQCAITNLKLEKDALTFDRADECLPMPVDQRAFDALQYLPVHEMLSKYELKIIGLTEERYALYVDEQPASGDPQPDAILSRKELERGCNLTLRAGPITEQAKQVLKLVLKKNELCRAVWDAQIHGPKAHVETYTPKLAEAEAKLDEVRQPKPHHFKLVPINLKTDGK